MNQIPSAIGMPIRMRPSVISVTQPMTDHSSDHQNVRISQVKCEATQVLAASSRFT